MQRVREGGLGGGGGSEEAAASAGSARIDDSREGASPSGSAAGANPRPTDGVA